MSGRVGVCVVWVGKGVSGRVDGCVWECVYLCSCVFSFVCVCICVCSHSCVFAFVCVRVRVCSRSCVFAFVCVRVRVCSRSCVFAFVCVCSVELSATNFPVSKLCLKYSNSKVYNYALSLQYWAKRVPFTWKQFVNLKVIKNVHSRVLMCECGML